MCMCMGMDMDRSRLKSSSSSQVVVLEDEDLLTLIFLCVPWKKLKVLEYVSKQWHSLITSPHFRNLLHLRASGLFIQHPFDDKFPHKICFVPLDDPRIHRTFGHDPCDPEKEVQILASCNGLFLCSTSIHCGQIIPYVYNPSTNQLDTLPQHPRHTGGIHICHVGLAFDPSKSIHYKVITLVRTSPSFSDFDIYSSETETWKASVKSPIPRLHNGVYWNGSMHWLGGLLGPYPASEAESSVSDCFYFNVHQERLETFPRPPIGMMSSSIGSTLYFGESEDHLHVTEICPGASSLTVYEMKSDHSDWFVKYQIDLDPIFKVFLKMKDKAIFYFQRGDYEYAVQVLTLVRRENFHEDSFLVLEIPNNIILYNLVDKSFRVLWDFTAVFDIKIDAFWRRGFTVWQYIESP